MQWIVEICWCSREKLDFLAHYQKLEIHDRNPSPQHFRHRPRLSKTALWIHGASPSKISLRLPTPWFNKWLAIGSKNSRA